jgi:hypothetical protein
VIMTREVDGIEWDGGCSFAHGGPVDCCPGCAWASNESRWAARVVGSCTRDLGYRTRFMQISEPSIQIFFFRRATSVHQLPRAPSTSTPSTYYNYMYMHMYCTCTKSYMHMYMCKCMYMCMYMLHMCMCTPFA